MALPPPQVLKRSGSNQQAADAAAIAPIIARPHLLLVTLLLCNAGAVEALPIFLDKLVRVKILGPSRRS